MQRPRGRDVTRMWVVYARPVHAYAVALLNLLQGSGGAGSVSRSDAAPQVLKAMLSKRAVLSMILPATSRRIHA